MAGANSVRIKVFFLTEQSESCCSQSNINLAVQKVYWMYWKLLKSGWLFWDGARLCFPLYAVRFYAFVAWTELYYQNLSHSVVLNRCLIMTFRFFMWLFTIQKCCNSASLVFIIDFINEGFRGKRLTLLKMCHDYVFFINTQIKRFFIFVQTNCQQKIYVVVLFFLLLD